MVPSRGVSTPATSNGDYLDHFQTVVGDDGQGTGQAGADVVGLEILEW